MERIIDLNLDKFGEVVTKNETLRTMFSQRIYEGEVHGYLRDKLECFENGTLNWELSLISPSFVRMYEGKEHEVLNGIEKSASIYGCTTNLQKRINQCRKLKWTNLFNYHVKNLLSQYVEEEIMDVMEWIEEMDYELYCGRMPDDLYDWLECFQSELGNYYYNEDTNEVFRWKKCS